MAKLNDGTQGHRYSWGLWRKRKALRLPFSVVKVSGSFTCYECWAKVEASLPPVLILNKPMKETEQ